MMIFAYNMQWNIAIGGDAAETGVGPGSYDIRQSVWHVNVSCVARVSLRCFSTDNNGRDSAAVLRLTAAAGGESSTPSSAGRTLLLTAASSHTIFTALRLAQHS